MKVSVSILKKKDDFISEVEKINNTSADYLHLDILDNTFAPNTSFRLSDFNNLKINKPLDIHIMSTNLDYQINEAIKLKPEIITFQFEATKDALKYIKLIKDNNIKVGIAINPKTRIYKIKKFLPYIDLLLVMGVNAGYGGQEFIPKTIKKLKKLNKYGRNYILSIDGGITNDSFNLVKEYVDMVVVGSYITNSTNYEEKIMKFK